MIMITLKPPKTSGKARKSKTKHKTRTRRHANNAGNPPGPSPIAPRDKISHSGEPLTGLGGTRHAARRVWEAQARRATRLGGTSAPRDSRRGQKHVVTSQRATRDVFEPAANLGEHKNRSEGFPQTGYFIPGRDGTGAWLISGVVRVTACAPFEVFGTFWSCRSFWL